jgi:hypothetical protein
MVKNLLRRLIGRSSLQYEDLQTILCDTEAVINSRPLTYLSEDPKDWSPLNTAMVIQGVPTMGVPILDHVE